MSRFTPLIISAAALLNSCTSLPTISSNLGFVTNKDVVFTPEKWPARLVADLYKPDASEPTPAVVLIHGGGWNKKERRGDMTGIAKTLAKRGYFVMNTTYRLTPDWQFPAQKEDIDLAILFMRKNAVGLNIDPERIATAGYSAGGHLAALAGLDPKNEIKTIIAGGAPTDLSLWPNGKLTGLLLGGPFKGNEKIYREASPVTFVRANSPPIFIYHGTDDNLVPSEHPETLITALTKNGVEHETYWIQGRSHIMAHLFSDRAIPKAVKFLDKHLKEGTTR